MKKNEKFQFDIKIVRICKHFTFWSSKFDDYFEKNINLGLLMKKEQNGPDIQAQMAQQKKMRDMEIHAAKMREELDATKGALHSRNEELKKNLKIFRVLSEMRGKILYYKPNK